jgi:hypothetical protein
VPPTVKLRREAADDARRQPSTATGRRSPLARPPFVWSWLVPSYSSLWIPRELRRALVPRELAALFARRGPEAPVSELALLAAAMQQLA